MKKIKYNIIVIAAAALVGLTACNDFLDRTPLSEVTPDAYFSTADQLLTYTITRYPDYLTTHGSSHGIGTFGGDNDTDNQSGGGAGNIWKPGEKLVPNDNKGGSWKFEKIRQINYFFSKVLPKYEAGEITGSKAEIKHAIGEAYFLRAIAHFDRLKELGDMPIITTPMPDKREVLVEESKRKPQNEVARFILQDLDKAIELLLPNPVSNKNRISKEAALVLKSRVALYEGTWLKYHKGTAFVPGGPGWPGASQYPNFSLDIDAEVDFFLSQAMDAASKVADRVQLTPNQGGIEGLKVFNNPYFMMFSDDSMEKYSEVILWRAYNTSYYANYIQPRLRLGGNSGYTRSLVESFLMKDGLPIYASPKYRGDNTLEDVVIDRDERLRLFMKQVGDTLSTSGPLFVTEKPNVTDFTDTRCPTGYPIKKGIFPNGNMMNSTNTPGNTGSIVFRASEAYLNYIEAQYVKEGNLNAKSIQYWQAIRRRAGVSDNIQNTISHTDLSREIDWAKYSHKQLIDATLYNIRRERRNEFIAEGMRMDDLRRWRSLDQVQGLQIEGFKLWGPMKEWYANEQGDSKLRYLPESSNANVSSPDLSDYIRPLQVIKENNKWYNGLEWTPAHYLEPIAFEELQLGSPSNNADNSNIYQNPGWPTSPGGTPRDVE